jgi:hypothetical protein
MDELSRLTRGKWRPATLSRLSALGARKSDQFDLLEAHWSALVESLGSTSGDKFADDAGPHSRRSRLGLRASWRTCRARPWRSSSRRCCVRARSCRCCAVRACALCATLRLDQLTEAGDGGALMLKRMERARASAARRETWRSRCTCASCRTQTRSCARSCTSRRRSGRSTRRTSCSPRQGFTHKPGQDYVSFATMVQRRYIAILQCAAVAIGVPALCADKKLHAAASSAPTCWAAREPRRPNVNAISAGRARCRAAITQVSGTRPSMRARGTCLLDARGATTRRTRCGSACRRPLVTATGNALDASPPLPATWPALRFLTRSSRSSSPSASRQPRAPRLAGLPAQAPQAARAGERDSAPQEAQPPR